jgi:hypothetical protein
MLPWAPVDDPLMEEPEVPVELDIPGEPEARPLAPVLWAIADVLSASAAVAAIKKYFTVSS